MFRYLLGRCTKDEQRDFEAAYVRDRKLFERLTELEQEILAAYERGELSTDDRKDVKDRLLDHRHPHHKT